MSSPQSEHTDDLKSEAQQKLGASDAPKPGEVYRHFRGGIYSIVCVSIKEDTLDVLVTYHSNLKGNNWTRTLANFTETVSYAADNPRGPCPRFVRVEM